MFDYDQPDVPVSAIADVVAEIKSSGKLPELSPEEKEQRWQEKQRYLAECAAREEQQREESRRKRTAAEAVAERQAEIERREWHKNYIAETKARLARQNQEWEMANLKSQVAQSRAWQQNVETAHANAIRQQVRNTLLCELHELVSPPQSAPEPEPVVVEREEDPTKLSYPKPHRWFE
jgi:hypothetical protein